MEKESFLKLAESHGISNEEAERVYDSIIIVAENIKQVVSEIWESLKPLANAINELENKSLEYTYKPYYMPCWDNRLKSQVITNKPRYMVRKII